MIGVGPGGRRGGRTDDFTDRIGDLKERGSAVLVTGSGSKATHVDLGRRLLGLASDQSRRRVFVRTNGTLPADLGGAADEPAVDRVITAAATRSAAATPPAASTPDVVDVIDGSLADVGGALVHEVEAMEREHGPPDPTELRVGVDSIAPLLDVHDERAVFEFLVYLTAYLRWADALGHVHLPADRTSYASRLLAPLFDAVVEVRVHGGQPQQRWHLDEGSVSSRWLPL